MKKKYKDTQKLSKQEARKTDFCVKWLFQNSLSGSDIKTKLSTVEIYSNASVPNLLTFFYKSGMRKASRINELHYQLKHKGIWGSQTLVWLMLDPKDNTDHYTILY